MLDEELQHILTELVFLWRHLMGRVRDKSWPEYHRQIYAGLATAGVIR